ncbi:MAG: glycosyltransferase family 4 protein [Actinobacteria bacterium]|nr:MAG: glycosyltransferase family 4 protein [Actinomycetota bacterium]
MSAADDRPVLFVTGHAPADRTGAFGRLHEREGVHFARFGGRRAHGGPEDPELRAPCQRIAQRDAFALAGSGDYRAVICGTAGRLALPGAWRGARRARVPFLLWASLWAHPRTAVHLLGYPLVRRIYADADAVVAYGSHVAAYVSARGARNIHLAPQAVDNDFWAAPADPEPPPDGTFRALFVGRPGREKGLRVLLEAWRASGLVAPNAALVLVGEGPPPPWVPAGGAVFCVGERPPQDVRNFYAGADVVVMPSISTPTFREPWGLVANEAMNQGTPVIASDAVGAVAGGLVRHERNGLVVGAGDGAALAGALRRLFDDAGLRARLGAAARRDVAAFTWSAWAAGFSAALASVGASRAGALGAQAPRGGAWGEDC